MSVADAGRDERIASGIPTPIAQLNPNLSDQSLRTVRGEVTITWPYSGVNETFAFLLAELDVRLRRAKGQIRVQLHGASARAVADLGLGGGDEVMLMLDGVAWAQDDTITKPQAARQDWQLSFSTKLLLQAKLGESRENKILNINQPAASSTAPLARLAEPILAPPATPAQSAPLAPSTAPARIALNPPQADEYASPAFIKRARVSYGSLFEGGFDSLEEDGAVKGKGRKRTRFGRESNAWRYSSQSLSPEPEISPDRVGEHSYEDEAVQSSPPRPQMLDEGVQTIDVEMAEPINGLSEVPQERAPALDSSPTPNVSRRIPSPRLPGFGGMRTTDQATEPAPISPPSGFTMFGSMAPRQDAYSAPRFQLAPHNPPSDGLSAADQVGFSFGSHIIPIQPNASTNAVASAIPLSTVPDSSAYPTTEAHGMAADLVVNGTRTGTAITEPLLLTGDQQALDPRLGVVPQANGMILSQSGSFQWQPTAPEPVTEVYEDALGPVEAEEAGSNLEVVDSSSVRPDDVPLGFASYGPKEVPAVDEEESEEDGSEKEAGDSRDVIETDEVVDDLEDHDVAVDHDDDEAEYVDEDGGDYDQRNYIDQQDDEEGYSEADEEADVDYDSDGHPKGRRRSHDADSELFDEEEEEDASSESHEDMSDAEDYGSDEEILGQTGSHPPVHRPPPAQTARKAPPEVIDLISDSEDEAEPPPKVQQIASPPKQTSASSTAGAWLARQLQEEAGEDFISKASDHASEHGEAESEQNELSLDDYEDSEEEDASSVDAEGELDIPEGELFAAETAAQVAGDALDVASPVENVIRQPLAQTAASEPPLRANQASEREVTPTDEKILDAGATHNEDAAITIERLRELEVQRLALNGSQQTKEEMIQNTSPSDIGVKTPYVGAGRGARSPMMEDEAMDSIPTLPVDGRTGTGAGRNDRPSPMLLSSSSPVQTNDGSVVEAPLVPMVLDEDNPTTLSSPSKSERVELSVTQKDATQSSPPTASQATTNVESDRQVPTSFESQTVIASFDASVIVHEKIPATETAIEVTSAEADRTLRSSEQSEAETAVTTNKTGLTRTLAAPELPVDTRESGSELASPPPQKVHTPIEASASLTAEEVEQPAVFPEKEMPEMVTSVSGEAEISQVVPSSATQPAVHVGAAARDGMVSKASESEAQSQPTPPVSPPRRKAKLASADPSIQFARATLASQRGKMQPVPVRTSPGYMRTRSMSFQESETPDAHDTSIELARAALRSPSGVTNSQGDSDGAATATARKNELNKRLRSDLPDCVPLKSLKLHLGKHLDVVGVATTQPSVPQRAKRGPREYVMSFNMTDPSIAPNTVVEVQFYRAHKESLPTVKPGDGILLRDFQAIALPKKGFGLRTHEASAWAVFDADDGSYQVKGPPVEVDATESDYMATLKAWYPLLDHSARGKLDKANQKLAESSQDHQVN